MDPVTESLNIYRDLADEYERLGQMSMRDRFLILAASAALEAARSDDAERFRHRLLQTSRYHMVRPYDSFAEAVQAPDVQTYIRDLRANYPLEVARQLLDSLLSGQQESLDRTQPIQMQSQSQGVPPVSEPPAPSQPIPQTAPLVDMFGRPTSTPARNNRQPGAPAPVPAPVLAPPTQPTNGTEGTPAPYRPLAQPAPGRVPMSRTIPLTEPPARPAAKSASAPQKTGPLPSPAPQSQAVRNTTPASPSAPGHGWPGLLLTGIIVVLGLAILFVTLARPFIKLPGMP